MKKFSILLLMLILVLNGSTAQGRGYINSETGFMELDSGEITLSEIYATAGIIVGADCTLTVEGDVEAGAFFICRGGRVYINGTLRADAIYFDSAEGELHVRLGTALTSFYTQCGGEVTVTGSIAARAGSGYDGRGLICVSSEFDTYNATRLELGGGAFARGGDLIVGAPQGLDEASAMSFYLLRGMHISGYGSAAGSGNTPDIISSLGLNATEGGAVVYNKY